MRFLGNYALVDKLKAEYGDEISIISIGPAGERKMAAASVAVTDMELRPTRHAGRGGVGAVMGAKGVKAIILDDKGCTMRNPKDPEKFKEELRKEREQMRKRFENMSPEERGKMKQGRRGMGQDRSGTGQGQNNAEGG